MPRSLLITFVLLLAGTTFLLSSDPLRGRSSSFAGTNAGDRRELLPGFPFRWCPAGTFTMGSPPTEWVYDYERPDNEAQVSVTLTQGYWLGETEVTQGQWGSVMGSVPPRGADFIADDNLPIVWLNPADATAFCETLTARERQAGRLPPGWKYALPTEAQWEHACRAGSTAKFCYGADKPELLDNYDWYDWERINQYAWSATNSGERLHPVGQKKPNNWGLRDMHGNASEWCRDWYAKKLQGGRDPHGPATGLEPVRRGGSCFRPVFEARSASRIESFPNREPETGFRLAIVSE